MQDCELPIPKPTSVIFDGCPFPNEETTEFNKQISSLISFPDDAAIDSQAEIRLNRKIESDSQSLFSPEKVLKSVFCCFEPLISAVIHNQTANFSDEFTDHFLPILSKHESEASESGSILMNYLRLILRKGEYDTNKSLMQQASHYSWSGIKWTAHILLQLCMNSLRNKTLSVSNIAKTLDSRTRLAGLFLVQCYLYDRNRLFNQKTDFHSMKQVIFMIAGDGAIFTKSFIINNSILLFFAVEQLIQEAESAYDNEGSYPFSIGQHDDSLSLEVIDELIKGTAQLALKESQFQNTLTVTFKDALVCAISVVLVHQHLNKDQSFNVCNRLDLLLNKEQEENRSEDSFLTSDALKTYLFSLEKLIEIIQARKRHSNAKKLHHQSYAEVTSHFEPTIQLLKEASKTLSLMCFHLIQKEFKDEKIVHHIETENITNEIKVLSEKSENLLNWVNV